MKHRWKNDDLGKVDNFAFENGIHNGPVCVNCGRSFCEHCEPECYDANDCEPVNIDLALAQIAEMERAEKPLTNGEKILERYANSIKRFANSRVEGKQINGKMRYYRFGVEKGYDTLAEALRTEEEFLNSPYTEGEKV